jgi:FkbM family methyltransferase
MLRLFHAAVRAYRAIPLPGAKRLARRVWDRYQASRGERTVEARIDGIRYELHLNELIDSSIYYTGSFEPFTTAAIRRILKKGDVALDIGANMGCHSLPMAKMVGETGRVIAFEPMPWARKKLASNIALNSFSNLQVVPMGLSDSAGRTMIHFRSSWSLDAKGMSFEDPTSTEKCAVEMVRLDDFLRGQNVARIDFIKLDVDGFELKVLRGARATLESQHPVILMELGAYTLRDAGDDIQDLVRFLLDLGYRFYDERSFDPIESASGLLEAEHADSTINVVVSSKPLS